MGDDAGDLRMSKCPGDQSLGGFGRVALALEFRNYGVADFGGPVG